MSTLPPTIPNIDNLALQLRRKRRELFAFILGGLYRSNDPALISLASRVAEIGDQNAYDLLANNNIPRRQYEIAELQEINLALQRIADGAYGICTDCGQPIELTRLNIFPATRICRECKDRFEKQRGIISER